MTPAQVAIVRRVVHASRTLDLRVRGVLRILDRSVPDDALLVGIAADELEKATDELRAMLKSEDDTKPA
mgnify:CR=1 FL=1